ncbi:DUF4886 domain-containing protein [Variovorax sp. PAMC 28711]|uniref:DUF4886 domain-containing protein n=1 Tax=Variovorax sp. PAMC 28711 TaxID=1795631 RepID=UPI00078E7184|nr:DUF4886 domain-containing protein [Variovorax sp. PAMC 28711]AMM25788.1 hypothetical protein AX767_16580 [Variovorax sp. PAMC 28711]
MTIFLRALLASAALALAACAPLPKTTAYAIPSPADAAYSNPTSSVYIGNSFFYFNNGITSHMAPLIAAGMPGFKHRSTMITISGSGADWHDVASYFRPDAVGKYSFDANNNVVFNKLDRLFDVAVMMDCSQCPIHPQLKSVFTDYAKKNADIARQNGARPVFFMSWAYQDVPAMTKQLADAYTQAGKDNNAQVIPAGLAFARSVELRPDVNLYIADKRHPTLAGSYLAACTTYATLFKRSPVGSSYTAGLDPSVARHLQQVAWDTAQAYAKQ